MPFYERGPVRIHYEEVGSGFPVLLIPGGGLNSALSSWQTASPFNPMERYKATRAPWRRRSPPFRTRHGPTAILLSTGDASFFRPGLSVCVGSGIHPAINGEIRAGNVRGLRTGDERHQRGDLINMPIAVERCGGLLRHRPIARRWIQIRVDRTWLDVIDGDTSARDFSGQPLTEHLHGALRGRVGYQPRHQDTFTHGRADHDDATARLHVLERCLRRDQRPADVDVDHAIDRKSTRLNSSHRTISYAVFCLKKKKE